LKWRILLHFKSDWLVGLLTIAYIFISTRKEANFNIRQANNETDTLKSKQVATVVVAIDRIAAAYG